jgi:polyisoprenyl-phosphate glycosyltransferase
MNGIQLDLIVPCFNEVEALPGFYKQINEQLGGINWRLIFVNDGSRDDTEKIINDLVKMDPRVMGIHFSRNFGHQAAISAGIEQSSAQCVVVMDADGQDPPSLIPKMIDEWRKGFEVVYGVRARRKASLFLKFSYSMYYRIMKSISHFDLPLNAGDFCLLDSKVVTALRSYPEKRKYWRGLRGAVGFRQIGVPYDRPERDAGESKYTIFKLVSLAADGIFNMSFFPLRLCAFSGAFIAVGAVLFGVMMFVWYLSGIEIFGMMPGRVSGWTSLVMIMAFLSGVQLLFLGVMGEYISRIFIEVKDRPEYHIAYKTNEK